MVVNSIREYQLNSGVPKAQAYDVTMYVLAGMLALGFVCNLLVRPVDKRHYMTEEELAHERKLASDKAAAANVGSAVGTSDVAPISHPVLILLAWSAVGIPMAIGIWITLQKALILFK